MYEENKERPSMKENQSNTPDDDNTISQVISEKDEKDNNDTAEMESISFLDYENYKKNYLLKDSTDLSNQQTNHEAQNNSDINKKHPLTPSCYAAPDTSKMSSGYGLPGTPQSQYPPYGNQNYNENPSGYGLPGAPQGQYPPYGNQNYNQNPSGYGLPGAPQGQYPPYGNQNYNQNPSGYGLPGAPQGQYPPYGNQNYNQNPSGYGLPGTPQGQYPPYGNQNYNQSPSGYSPQNTYPYINSNIPPIHPGNNYPDVPLSQPPYCYPNVPPGRYIPPNQFRPGNPYYSHFQQMPKDYYTLKEIRKSYNRAGLTLLIHSVGTIVIQLILILVFALSFISSGTNINNLFTSSDIEASSALVAVLSISFTNVICAAIGLAFTRRLSELPHIFKAPQMNFKTVVWALLSVYALQGIINILHALYFSLERNPDSVTDPSLESINPDVIIIYFFYSVILAPITEEILFRGMILKNLSVVNKKYAIIFSAVLFGLFHENFPQMITATIIGILLAYVAVKSNSIIIPICLHVFNNFSVEIINSVPDCIAKTIIVSVIYFGIGTFSIIMFIRSMKNSDTPDDTYRRIYEFEDLSIEKRASLSSALASPAMVVYLVLFTLVIIFDICKTTLF